ncbi:MAG: helix-turn-helix transcriptional regulator [Bellilinea sp.]
MDLSTRDQILATLQRYPNSTVEELSRLLQLTHADVRYHINALLKAGQVVQMQQFPKDGRLGRGRPAKSYQLSAGSRPDILTHLTDILLEMIQSNASADASLAELAQRLIPANSLSSTETHAPGRLNEAIQMINQHPYQARWEAHASGPQVFFHNCPFAAVIRKHPELCQVDSQILQNLTGLAPRQIRKIDLDGPTAVACVFILTQSQVEQKG